MKQGSNLMYARMNKVVSNDANHLKFYDMSGIEINPVKRKRKRPDLSEETIAKIRFFEKHRKIEWLKENHNKYSTKSIAAALNISPSAVSSKLTHLQLRQAKRECAQLKRIGICCRKKCVKMLSDQELVYYFNSSNMAKNEVEKKQIIYEMFAKMKYLSNFPCVKWCLSFGISRSYRQNVIDKINRRKGTNEVKNGNKGRKSSRRLNSSTIKSLDDFIINIREPDSHEKELEKESKTTTPIVNVQTQPITEQKENHKQVIAKPIKLKTSNYTPSSFKVGTAQSGKFHLTFHNETSENFAANHYDTVIEEDDSEEREDKTKHSASQQQPSKKEKIHAHMQSKLTLNKHKKEENIPGTATLDFSTPLYQNTQPQQPSFVPQPLPLPIPHIPAPLQVEALPERLPPLTSFQSATQAIPASFGEYEYDELEYQPIQAIGSIDDIMEDDSDDERKVVVAMSPVASTDFFMEDDDESDNDFNFEDDDDEDDDELPKTSSQVRPPFTAGPPVPPLSADIDDDELDFEQADDEYDTSMLNPELPSVSFPPMMASNTNFTPSSLDAQMLNPPLPTTHLPLPYAQPPHPILPAMSDLPPPTLDYANEINARALSHALLPLNASEENNEREATPPLTDMGSFKFPQHVKSISDLYKLYKDNLKSGEHVIKETKFRQLLKNRHFNTRIVRTSNHSLSNELTSSGPPMSREQKPFKVIPSYASAAAKPDHTLLQPVMPLPMPQELNMDDDDDEEEEEHPAGSVQAISATDASQQNK